MADFNCIKRRERCSLLEKLVLQHSLSIATVDSNRLILAGQDVDIFDAHMQTGAFLQNHIHKSGMI